MDRSQLQLLVVSNYHMPCLSSIQESCSTSYSDSHLYMQTEMFDSEELAQLPSLNLTSMPQILLPRITLQKQQNSSTFSIFFAHNQYFTATICHLSTSDILVMKKDVVLVFIQFCKICFSFYLVMLKLIQFLFSFYLIYFFSFCLPLILLSTVTKHH